MHLLEHSGQTQSLSEALLELVWPTRCAGCERSGVLLCNNCAQELLFIEASSACLRCGAPYGSLLCTECYSSQGLLERAFTQAVCCVEMNQLSGRLVVLYKDHHERRLAFYIAQYLAACLPDSWLQWAEVLTWIPADKRALRRRGFDHMEQIAQELALPTRLPCRQLFKKHSLLDQRGLNRAKRSENLQESFSLVASKDPLPAHILLVDDVFTTGATLNAASELLLKAGATEVRVSSFVRVW